MIQSVEDALAARGIVRKPHGETSSEEEEEQEDWGDYSEVEMQKANRQAAQVPLQTSHEKGKLTGATSRSCLHVRGRTGTEQTWKNPRIS